MTPTDSAVAPEVERRTVRLILVRHGETDWNRDGRFQGRADVALNAAGRRQSEEVARQVARWSVDVVYASPLQRAVETARAIAAACDVRVRISPLLAELSFGEWEGIAAAERRARWPAAAAAWAADPFGTTAPGGESFAAACARATEFLESLPHDSGSRTLVVCGHGMINGAIAHVLTGEAPRLQDNGGIRVLEGLVRVHAAARTDRPAFS